MVLEDAGIPHQVVTGTGKTQLDAVTQAIQASRFGIYRVDAECSPDAFLTLGIAIGLDRPWAIVSREGATLPSDIRGLSGVEFRSFSQLGEQFLRRFGDFLDQYA
jgi:hypothetical protein